MARTIKRGRHKNGSFDHTDHTVRSYYSRESKDVRKDQRRKSRRIAAELLAKDPDEVSFPTDKNTQGWLTH